MKRIFLIFALCLSAAILLTACAPSTPETPIDSETESTKAPAYVEAEDKVDELVNQETSTEAKDETNPETKPENEPENKTETESETEPVETHNVIVGDDLDDDASPVPNEDETVGDEWELGGVPLN